jgi:hypothetical protein
MEVNFNEAVQFVAEREFRLYDIGTCFRGPYDAALMSGGCCVCEVRVTTDLI